VGIVEVLLAYPRNAVANFTPDERARLAKAVKEEFGNGRQVV